MRFLERFWFGCGRCHDGQGCPLAEGAGPGAAGRHEYDQGAALVGAVLLVFILPLGCALGGAYLAGRGYAGPSLTVQGWWQLGGGLGGFAAGVALARVVLRICRRPRRPADGGLE